MQLTGQLVSVWAEQYAEPRLVVDGTTGVVGLALLEAVGQHQRAGDVVQYVRRRWEHVSAQKKKYNWLKNSIQKLNLY